MMHLSVEMKETLLKRSLYCKVAGKDGLLVEIHINLLAVCSIKPYPHVTNVRPR